MHYYKLEILYDKIYTNQILYTLWFKIINFIIQFINYFLHGQHNKYIILNFNFVN